MGKDVTEKCPGMAHEDDEAAGFIYEARNVIRAIATLAQGAEALKVMGQFIQGLLHGTVNHTKNFGRISEGHVCFHKASLGLCRVISALLLFYD